MPKQRLTDRQFISGVTLSDLLHFVVTGDTSQNPAGSSYKGSVEQLFNTFSSFTCTYPLIVDTVNSCSGSITINGDVTINGSATTINTQIIQSQDNNIVLNYSGTHLTAIGGGITVEDGQSDGVDSSIYTDSNGTWLFNPGLSASTGTINNFTANTISVTTIGDSGDCVNDLYVSNIHSCSPLNINPLDEGNVYFGSNSGVTIDVTNSRIGIGTNSPTEKLDVSGNTKISGTLNIGNILGNSPIINLGLDSNGFVVTGVTTIDTNTFTTGATLNGTIIEFDRNDLSNAYNVDLSSLQFTGNTSGNCITDLYVSNIHSCSPLNINPLNEGNVYFGSTSGLTVDLSTNRVGINSTTPNSNLDIRGTFGTKLSVSTQGSGAVANGTIFGLYNPTVTSSNGLLFYRAGGQIDSPSNFNDAETPIIANLVGYVYKDDDFRETSKIRFGVESLSSSTYNGYITLFTTNGTISSEKMRITSEGNVGIGTATPSEILDVSGKTKTTNFQMTSGATNGYVLTSDVSGNASWQAPIVTGDTNFANTNLIFTTDRTHNTDGNYLWIQTSGSSAGSTIYMDATNWIDVGFASPNNYTRWSPTFIQTYYNNLSRENIVSSETVFNDGANDINFRVEGDTDTHLLFVDAGTDEVGVGTNNPLGKLHIANTENNPVLVIDGLKGGSNFGKWQHYTVQGDVTTTSANTSNIATISLNNGERMTLTGKITAKGMGNLTVGGTFTAVANCESGSANIIGTVDTSIKENSAGTPSVNVVTSGTNVIIQVTGGGEDLSWLCTYEYQIISPPVS
jgi:hypothetical protein